MTPWAYMFLGVAIIAGVFGFTDLAGASAGVAQILFALFALLFLVAVVARAIDND